LILKKYYNLYLTPETENLKEVLVSNENKANALIKKVIFSKGANNPLVKFKTFEFKTYSKIIVTANSDSIKGRIDSVFVTKKGIKTLSKIDSSDYIFKRIVNKQHLFQTEKVSSFQYSNNHLKETVIGTKMAGFKQPIYEVLGFNLQSFSIYDNQYALFETNYKSPIHKNSFDDYRFQFLGTTKVNEREVALIHFKNKKKQTGLEGLLYIDTKSFAIAKAVMRIKGVLDITGIHEFEYLKMKIFGFQLANLLKLLKAKTTRT